MAVSMNVAVRSDFMISDAAMPQRMAELDKAQAAQMAQFAKILSDIDGGGSVTEASAAIAAVAANGTGAAANGSVMDAANLPEDVQSALRELRDFDEKFDKALKALESELRGRVTSAESGKDIDGVFRNKRTGEVLPTDVHELAQMVVSGKLDVRDIPDELMTPELMQAIIALMIEMRYNKEPEKDDEPEEALFDPAVAAVNEQNFSREVSDRMLTELYGIIEKHNERQGEENVTILDGISEPTEPDETLASVATGGIHKQEQAEKGMFDQIIDNMVEMVEKSDDTAQIEGTPVIQTREGEKPAANEARSEVPDEVAVVAEQTAQTAAPSEQSDGAQMQLGTQTQKAEVVTEAPEADREIEFAGVIESITVKEASVSEPVRAERPQTEPVQTEQPQTEPVQAEQPQTEPVQAERPQTEPVQTERPQTAAKASSDPAGRVQNASEELEMLKSAKQLIKASGEGEGDFKLENETENGTAQTNTSAVQLDQPIVFTRDDGTKIEVRPSEIVEQTEKIIERAVAETKEQSEYSLVLNPEELGRITVKLIKAADGAISVTIAAENAHTQRVLEQHSELMQNNLRSSGVDLESWQTVNESQQETFTQDYNGSSKNPYFRQDNQKDEGEEQGGTTFAEIIASM